MEPQSQPDLQLACPVCAAYNQPDFRFCPHCGHRLGAPDMVELPFGRRGRGRRALRLFLLLCLLAAGMQVGLGGLLWQHLQAFLARQPPTAPVTVIGKPLGSGGETEEGLTSSHIDPMEPPPAATPVSPNTQTAKAVPPEARQPLGTTVELILFDREGDQLRQAHGLLSHKDQRVVTTFASIYGAYSGYVRLADDSTPAITAVEQADSATDLAILSLIPPPAAAGASPATLETTARLTYEETPVEQGYFAEKRARAQRWDEAVAHWKHAIELDPSQRQEVEPKLAAVFLEASDADLRGGDHAERHARLLDAVEWLPEHGELRLRLAGSFFALGEYRDALDHYSVAFDLSPAQAADITKAVVRTYREWGLTLLRQGDFLLAANVLREALQLDSVNGELYFVLGQAEFRRQELDAAIQAFEAALSYEPGLRIEVEPYLTKARALQGGPQTAVINFLPGSTRIEVPVMINSRLEVPFIIDTGASTTLIPMWAAEMLGYRPQPASEWVRVQTAGGARRLPFAALNRLEIQGLGLSNLSVLYGDLPEFDARRGLLGMDFLRHFSLAVDHDLGRMTLRLK
jgi:tetratricopeptide (TPR) repeat protein